MTDKKVRVRFAPSPTGPLHIGGVRTALYNYLFAKHCGGDFLLRIEDTDQNRYVPGAEEYIIKSLLWCGLVPDEGPDGLGGNYGPYRQSERKAMYKEYADTLVSNGWAYYAFDTPEELDALRKEAEAQGKAFIYNASTRAALNNSLNMTPEALKAKLDQGGHYVIRFKIPAEGDITVHDMIRGDVHFHLSELDDKVLYKSDGMPTYHLANIVDDHTMEITHVIRGEEWLASMPLHVLLYRAFGWTAPQFAHLPLILKPSGKGKLSKRDGDQGGFPVFPLEWHAPTGEVFSGYREKGYLKDAFINMLALLGWNDSTEQEIYTMDELIAAFNLEKVGKSGARFDPEKTKWFNQQYVKALSDDDFFAFVSPVLASNGITTDAHAKEVCALVKERCTFPEDIMEHAGYFFIASTEYDAVALKKRWKEGSSAHLLVMADIINEKFAQGKEVMHDAVIGYANEQGLSLGLIMNALRIALVGTAKGPDIFDIVQMLGKDETVARVKRAVEVVKI
ncbi:MAG: glutamate--tRNA ligase [Flavobacteriales bacterium]|nr:glutamate--tRNA ligase [Flavobacteriales bacterium]